MASQKRKITAFFTKTASDLAPPAKRQRTLDGFFSPKSSALVAEAKSMDLEVEPIPEPKVIMYQPAPTAEALPSSTDPFASPQPSAPHGMPSSTDLRSSGSMSSVTPSSGFDKPFFGSRTATTADLTSPGSSSVKSPDPFTSGQNSSRAALAFKSPPSHSKPGLSFDFLDKASKKIVRNEAFAKKNEQRYRWLQSPLDAKKRSPSDPDYDPTTLHIPSSAFSEMSPFEQQYWSIKQQNMDVVIFFKKGKFYELYEMDADVGHQEFDLKMTDRVNMRMAGVPESSFEFWAAKLVARGYKVGRVEQMEAAKNATVTNSKSKSKICERELTQVLTAGTLTDLEMIESEQACFLVSIKHGSSSGIDRETPCGLTIVDASRGLMYLAYAPDLSSLETILLQVRPKEVLIERAVKRSLKMLDHLKPVCTIVEMPSALAAERTVDSYEELSTSTSVIRMRENDLVMISLAGALSYLKTLLLDIDIVSMRKIHLWDATEAGVRGTNMLLDGQVLTNLEIFENLQDGGQAGTLYRFLNRCITPSGKRTLKQWLMQPLQDFRTIEARLDAVEDIINMYDLRADLLASLRQAPDFERLLARIHSFSRKGKKQAHMVDNVDEKRKALFLQLLQGLRSFATMVQTTSQYGTKCKSSLIREIWTASVRLKNVSSIADEEKTGIIVDDTEPDVDMDPNVVDVSFWEHVLQRVEYFSSLVDAPETVEPDYMEACEAVTAVERKLEEHLNELRQQFRDSSIQFKDMGKELYQVEIPKRTVDRNKIPSSFEHKSSTKDASRYWTPTIVKLLPQLEEAVDYRDACMKTALGKLFALFMEEHVLWVRAGKRVADLDCLYSLAEVSAKMPVACRPTFVPRADDEPPVLALKQVRHPCMDDFIPNDAILGGSDHESVVLVTGPNMGGKSTMLRSTCIAVIMAQLGCFVAAEQCTMTPVDRVYTRLGASDRIMMGQSTFQVELEETSVMLAHASRYSLVILDELGRGTSTFDGYAIAYAVVQDLASRLKCRTLFSTHYFPLTDEFGLHPNVATYHMACKVDDNSKSVVFLYKFLRGVCPKSYGLNVALHAGIPLSVVDRADRIAQDFESESGFHIADPLLRLHRMYHSLTNDAMVM